MCDSRKDFSDEEEKYSDDRNAGIRKEHHRRASCEASWIFLRGCGSCDPGEDRKTFEEQANLDLDVEKSVIAPGGSVIYEAKAMEHYKETATIVYLKLNYEDLEARLGNLVDRGVVLKDGMTLRDLYNERLPYYEKYADITLDETGKEFGELVDELRAYFEGLEK